MIQVVTIDGPAGAGKSSVSRCLAERLGWRLLDTGAMYRTVTLAAVRREVDLRSDDELSRLVDLIQVVITGDEIYLDGEVVTETIRSVEVTRLTRHAADSPGVRRRLETWQRAFAEAERNVVAEGRDQGTIVFPNALRKYFLTANDEERAKRRLAELTVKGVDASLEEILKSVRDRDAGDEARSIAPMVAAGDAQVIDSSGLTFDQVVALLEHDVRSHLTSGC